MKVYLLCTVIGLSFLAGMFVTSLLQSFSGQWNGFGSIRRGTLPNAPPVPARDLSELPDIRPEWETLYRLMAEYSADMIRLADAGGQTVYASPSHLKQLGIPSSPFFQQEMFDQLVHPEDLPQVQAHFRTVMETRHPQTARYRMLRPDGRTG